MLRGLRDSLTGDLHAGVAVWAVDGVSRRDLTSIANATEIDEMEDVARLPYCAAVPPPYSAEAETYSNHFCVGDPPAVQDEDHAYDLRHDASQVWGLTTGTYYAQALLRCHDALIPQNDAFRLCVVVTDGQTFLLKVSPRRVAISAPDSTIVKEAETHGPRCTLAPLREASQNFRHKPSRLERL